MSCATEAALGVSHSPLDTSATSGWNALGATPRTPGQEEAAATRYSACILAETGFLMRTYNPDGSVVSSWQAIW